MGTVLISLATEQENVLRRLAMELYGGKKGALSAVVSAGIDELAAKDKRQLAIEHQLALMKKGFDFGLKGRKPYENRSDLYD
jgi:hypothetical protein